MKRGFKIAAAFILLNTFWFLLSARAQNTPEDDYRLKWKKAHQQYSQEYLSKLKEEEKNRDIKLYLEMGKDYFFKKEYSMAIVCFRNVIELESDSQDKKHSELAQEFISQIENNIEQQIGRELRDVLKQDPQRYQQGIKRLLARVSSEPVPERERKAEIKQKEDKAESLINKRRLELKKELQVKKLEFEKELQLRYLELIKKQGEIDGLLNFAQELLRKKSYPEAVIQLDKVLALDADNLQAKKLKSSALYSMEREKRLQRKEEEKAKRNIEELKRRQEAERQREQERVRRRQEAEMLTAERKKENEIRSHLNKGREFLGSKQHLRAIEEFKAVLLIDPEHIEARFALAQIKAELEKASGALEGGHVFFPAGQPSQPQAEAAGEAPLSPAPSQ